MNAKFVMFVHINDIQNEAKIKRNHLESQINQFDLHQQTENKLFEEKKRVMLDSVHEKPGRYQELLITKMTLIYSEIELYMTVKKIKAAQNDFTLRKVIEKDMNNLDDPALSENFLNAYKIEETKVVSKKEVTEDATVLRVLASLTKKWKKL
jgi:hypothetical protein